MDANQLQTIRIRIMQAVAEGRSVVEALAAEIEAVMGQTERLTPEARRADVARLVAERRGRIERMASEARRVLVGARADQDADIATLVSVGPGELDAADRALRPVLNASAAEPGLLVNLYRSRHRDNAERLLIEQTAAALIDGLGGLDDYAFRDSWRSLQQELAAERGPEEMEANARARELDEMAEYVDASEAVAMVDLSLMDPASEAGAEERGGMTVGRQLHEAQVNEYESNHASGAGVPG